MLEITNIEQTVDMVNQPPHYMVHEMECIDEMIVVFGPERTAEWCCQTAWKYRYRAGAKGSAEEDQKKADWYLRKAREIQGGKIWQHE